MFENIDEAWEDYAESTGMNNMCLEYYNYNRQSFYAGATAALTVLKPSMEQTGFNYLKLASKMTVLFDRCIEQLKEINFDNIRQTLEKTMYNTLHGRNHELN